MIGVAVAVTAGLTLGAYAVGVRPLLRHRDQEIAQRKSLDDQRATALQLGSAVAGLQRELAAAKQALAQSPVRLQPAVLVNQRLEAVARLATECGLSLDEVRPGAAVDATHFQTVPIRILGSGRYPACATFLRNLRRTFGDMGVRSFNASSTLAATDAPNAIFQAELVWFTELPHK